MERIHTLVPWGSYSPQPGHHTNIPRTGSWQRKQSPTRLRQFVHTRRPVMDNDEPAVSVEGWRGFPHRGQDSWILCNQWERHHSYVNIFWTGDTYVVDCWFNAPMNGSLQLLIKNVAEENKHICWRRSMYDMYHSRTKLSSKPGTRVFSPGWIIWSTSQRATQVWTSPASALSKSSDFIVGIIANCIAFIACVGVPLVGSSSSPDPLSILATDLHMRARGLQLRSSATSPLWRHKSTRVLYREFGYNMYKLAKRERWTNSGAMHKASSLVSMGSPLAFRSPWSTTLNTWSREQKMSVVSRVKQES